MVICPRESGDFVRLSKFLDFLESQDFNYEVIVCTQAKSLLYQEIGKLVNQKQNVSAYEIQSNDRETIVSFGMQQALGDWIIELCDMGNLQEDFLVITEDILSQNVNSPSVLILSPKKRTLRDFLLVKLASRFLPFEVYSFETMSRASNRAALQNWNRRAFKSKVVQAAPLLSHETLIKVIATENSRTRIHSKKLLRRSVRTMVYSSITPLRFISISALLAAMGASIYSVYVVLIKYGSDSTPGWASTNLILSLTSLAVLAILSVLCEYIYQLIGVFVHSDSADISQESISAKYTFQNEPNIEKIDKS